MTKRAQSKPKTVRIYLRCNDLRGKFSGAVTQVQIPKLVHLAAPDAERGTPMSVRGTDTTRLEIGGVFAQASGYQVTAQFPLWDAATLTPTGATMILNHLRRLGWSVVDGAPDLVAKYTRRDPLTPDDLKLQTDDEPRRPEPLR